MAAEVVGVPAQYRMAPAATVAMRTAAPTGKSPSELSLVPRSSGVPPIASFDGRINFYVLPSESAYVDLLPGRHWITTDMGNRIQSRPYRQVPDSLEFHLVRAKLRAQSGMPRDAVTEFETRLADRNLGGGETVVRYGLAQAYVRDGRLRWPGPD